MEFFLGVPGGRMADTGQKLKWEILRGYKEKSFSSTGQFPYWKFVKTLFLENLNTWLTDLWASWSEFSLTRFEKEFGLETSWGPFQHDWLRGSTYEYLNFSTQIHLLPNMST